MTFEPVDVEALRGDGEFWSLYEATFPPSSREPAEVIIRSVETGVGMAVRAREQGRTVGLATTHLLRDPAAVFLVYLAVAPEVRGRGVGRRLFESAARLGLERTPGAIGVVWEIDVPTAEDGCSLRRLRFFESIGGQMLMRPYVQPPVDGASEVPMTLMFRPASGGNANVEALVRAMYFEKYGTVNGIAEETLRSLLERR